MAQANEPATPSVNPDRPGVNDTDDPEYATYRAAVPIDVDGSRRYNPGDIVPKSVVDGGLIDKSLVVGLGDQAAPLGALRVADGTTSQEVASVSTDGTTPEYNPMTDRPAVVRTADKPVADKPVAKPEK